MKNILNAPVNRILLGIVLLLTAVGVYAGHGDPKPTSLIPCTPANSCQLYKVPVSSVNSCVDISTVTPDGLLSPPSLQVQDWGNANAPNVILFMHGFPHSHTIWYNQILQLDKTKYRVVTMDIRGHGNSFKPLANSTCTGAVDSLAGYKPADFANDTQAVITSLHLSPTQKLFLAGHSYAGDVMSKYVQTYGTGALTGLIFVDTAGLLAGPADVPACAGKFYLGPVFANNFVNMSSADMAVSIAATQAFLDGSVYNVKANHYSKIIEPQFLGADMAVPADVRFALIMSVLAFPNPLTVLTHMDKPVLLIGGANDQVILPGVKNCAGALIPQGLSTVVNLKQAGHFPQLEQASQFNKALTGFIDNCHQTQKPH